MSNCRFCKKQFKKNYRAQKFCSLKCANRFNPINQCRAVALPASYSEDLAEAVGILLGDGSITNYFVKVYLNRKADQFYVPFVIHLFRTLFPGASVTLQYRENEGTAEIQISSKRVCDYFRSIGFDPRKKSIPAWIFKSQVFIRAVIRGLFDTEGSVGLKLYKGKRKYSLYKQLTFTQINPIIFNFVEKNLIRLRFSSTRNSYKNIYLSNKENIFRYFEEIGSHNPKLVNQINIYQLGDYIY